MNNSWINRIGIFLSFLAGFMIAPELIGIKRIKKAETYIRRKLQYLADLMRQIYTMLKSLVGEGNFLANIGGGISYIVWIIFYQNLFNLVWNNSPVNPGDLALDLIMPTLFALIFAVPFFDRMLTRIGLPRPLSLKTKLALALPFILFWLILGILWPLLAALYGVGLILGSLGLLLIVAIFKILNFLISKLGGKGRLRAILVAAGIIFYVLGNVLQLIAN